MKRHFIGISMTVLALVCLVFGQSDKTAHSQMGAGGSHIMMTANDVKWGPGPPALPPGVQMALLEGDPTKAGSSYVIRAKMPDGYKIQPHWHPVTENVTVLEGSLYLGIGEKFDQSAGRELTPGAFASMTKGTRHFAWTKGETVIQVHGVGPFEVIYLNPADDPRKKASPK